MTNISDIELSSELVAWVENESTPEQRRALQSLIKRVDDQEVVDALDALEARGLDVSALREAAGIKLKSARTGKRGRRPATPGKLPAEPLDVGDLPADGETVAQANVRIAAEQKVAADEAIAALHAQDAEPADINF